MTEVVTNSKLFKFSKTVHPIKSYDHFCAAIRSCSGPYKFFRRQTPPTFNDKLCRGIAFLLNFRN